MLGRLNEVLARHAVNIAAQYYETDHDVGYVVLDADASAADGQRVLADIRALEGTIRARLLYEYKARGHRSYAVSPQSAAPHTIHQRAPQPLHGAVAVAARATTR